MASWVKELQEVPATGTILLFEADKPARTGARVCLGLQGYNILETESYLDAIKVWEQGWKSISMLITSAGDSGAYGVRLAKALLEMKPELKVLFTGDAFDPVLAHLQRANRNVHLLTKPYALRKLSETVGAILTESVPGS